MWSNKAVKLNRFLAVFFVSALAFLVCGNNVYCQSTTVKPKKKSEIKIPKTALDPAKTKEGFNHDFDEAVNGILTVSIPETAAKYREDDDGTLICCSYVMFRRNKLEKLVCHPDLEEVLRVKRDWYVDFYNKTQVLPAAAAKIEAAVGRGDEEAYAAAVKQYKDLADNLNDVWKSRSKNVVRLTPDQLKALREKNRKRRAQEYVKLYRLLEKDGLLPKNALPEDAGKDKKSPSRKN